MFESCVYQQYPPVTPLNLVPRSEFFHLARTAQWSSSQGWNQFQKLHLGFPKYLLELFQPNKQNKIKFLFEHTLLQHHVSVCVCMLLSCSFEEKPQTWNSRIVTLSSIVMFWAIFFSETRWKYCFETKRQRTRLSFINAYFFCVFCL